MWVCVFLFISYMYILFKGFRKYWNSFVNTRPKTKIKVIRTQRDLLWWGCLFQRGGSCQQSELVEGRHPSSPSAGWGAWPGQTVPWSAYLSVWCLQEPCGPIRTQRVRPARGWAERKTWLMDAGPPLTKYVQGCSETGQSAWRCPSLLVHWQSRRGRYQSWGRCRHSDCDLTREPPSWVNAG